MEVREFFRDRFTIEELRSLLEKIGMTPRELVSKRSRPYQALGLAEKNFSNDELLALMVEHPALLRRPLVIRESNAVVGYDQEGLAGLLAGEQQNEE